jgi:hypothetical protein
MFLAGLLVNEPVPGPFFRLTGDLMSYLGGAR